MPATQLGIYNEALVEHLGERSLASLTENRESRRTLDALWSYDFLSWCLEQADWNFACRTAQGVYSPSVEPTFGFAYAFDKPDDWVRTIGISATADVNNPMTAGEYRDEAGFWFTCYQTIYVQYVSNDPEYGLNIGNWTASFGHWVAAELARRACTAIAQDKTLKDTIGKESSRLLDIARSKDAMSQGSKQQPTGNWVRSRGGYNRGGWGNGGGYC